MRTEFVMLVQVRPKEYYDKTQVEESRSSVVGNVEEAVPMEIGGINFEETNAPARGVTETQNAVPEGYADEGEEIEAIVALLDLADQNALREEELLEESIDTGADADDEEDEEVVQQSDDGPLPDEWNRRDKASMVVHDGHRLQWEYSTNMIRVKQVFRNKSALQEAVCLWALSSMREFWVKISSQEKYAVYCKKPGCHFRVYAHKPKYEMHWEASIVVNHSCQLEGGLDKA